MKRFFFLLALCLSGIMSYAGDINIIPRPQELIEGEGFFTFTAQTQIGWNSPEARQVAEFFAEKLKTAHPR